MSVFEIKVFGYKLISELLLRAINITTLWCFYILATAYKYMVLGVEAKYLYAAKAAKTVLPSIWYEVLSPMVWKIPLLIVIDIIIKVYFQSERKSS